MTGRILAGFLGVLAAVLAAVVIPLGIIVTEQQTQDFRDQANSAARGISAIAEEHLDDRAPATGLRTVLNRFAGNGYSAVVLDADGLSLARAGSEIPAAVVEAADKGAPLPQIHDTLVVSAPIDDANRRLGQVVLARDTAALERRQGDLWAALTVAAATALALGALIAWLLSRWIARPLTSLAVAAQGIGHGDTDTRADELRGPAQVREVATTFNTMAERVSTLLHTQRGMTAEVSHQLRTPLAALRLRLELLHDELTDTQAAEVAAMIGETSRLARLLDGLLAVARAQAISLTATPTNLSAIASERLSAWEPVAADQHVTLFLDAAHTIVNATPGYPEQILDNLLDNAIEATPPGGSVRLTIRPTTTSASLIVADTGHGMDREQRIQALNRYVTDRANDGGTGLGLAIVKRLVEADHGTINLHDTPGGGLTVRIQLPLQDPPLRPGQCGRQIGEDENPVHSS